MSPSLAHLAELHAASTPGRWHSRPLYNDRVGDNRRLLSRTAGGDVQLGVEHSLTFEDAASIVALHNTFPDLLAELQAAETLIGEKWVAHCGEPACQRDPRCPECGGLQRNGHYPGCDRAAYFEAHRKREEAK